jgi:hypothetical protein
MAAAFLCLSVRRQQLRDVTQLVACLGACLFLYAVQEEGVKAGKAREQMAAKLLQLEKQRGDVEVMRDELKAREMFSLHALLYQ